MSETSTHTPQPTSPKANQAQGTPQSKQSARQQRMQERARDERRRRYLIIGGGAAIALALLALIVYLIASQPQPTPIEGVMILPPYPGGQHTEGPIAYPVTPPAGGPHNPVWQNCGYYDGAIGSEY